MKYTFQTNDETEAKRLMAAKNAISIIYDIQEYLIRSDMDCKYKDEIFEILNEIDLDILWS